MDVVGRVLWVVVVDGVLWRDVVEECCEWLLWMGCCGWDVVDGVL